MIRILLREDRGRQRGIRETNEIMKLLFPRVFVNIEQYYKKHIKDLSEATPEIYGDKTTNGRQIGIVIFGKKPSWHNSNEIRHAEYEQPNFDLDEYGFEPSDIRVYFPVNKNLFDQSGKLLPKIKEESYKNTYSSVLHEIIHSIQFEEPKSGYSTLAKSSKNNYNLFLKNFIEKSGINKEQTDAIFSYKTIKDRLFYLLDPLEVQAHVAEIYKKSNKAKKSNMKIEIYKSIISNEYNIFANFLYEGNQKYSTKDNPEERANISQKICLAIAMVWYLFYEEILQQKVKSRN